ncbi:unnamed protein product [Allacma fusca]|uniref:Uncharacterized protein n=1 Tax=Allacma fusca TaxID=39272 RepID=A0A8J2KRJ9_9HEXA|nr:unnamed protein product [Allacma fusca]
MGGKQNYQSIRTIGISCRNIHQFGKSAQIIKQSTGTAIGIVVTQKFTSYENSSSHTTIISDSNSNGVAVGILADEIDISGSYRLDIRDRRKYA